MNKTELLKEFIGLKIMSIKITVAERLHGDIDQQTEEKITNDVIEDIYQMFAKQEPKNESEIL